MKIKNFRICLILFILAFFSIKNVYSESLEDLANELDTIRSEISKLETPVVTNPIVPVVNNFGKPMTGMIINSSDSNVVTFLPIGPGTLGAKPQTGVLLNASNVKDLAKRQSAELAAQQVAEQIQAEASIDKALKEIDKASEFMEKSYKEGDIDGAIAALAFIDVSISDVSNNIPSEFSSEIVKEGREFSQKEMDKINEITLGINNKKEKDFNELKENIESVTERGLKVQELTKQIISSGIETPKLNDFYAQVANTDLKENMKDSMKYSSILGSNVNEIDMAVRQMEAIKSGDAKKIRAIEIEKYGIAAGLSKEQINAGINAVYNGNLELEKQISKTILDKLSNNKNFSVQKMSDNEFDNYMQEQIAIDAVSQKITDSNIDFSGDVSKKELNNLANEIGNILSGKVSESKINEIQTQIKIGTYNYGGTQNMKASIVADLNGQNYVDALQEARNSGRTNVFGNKTTRTLAARAAAVEASLSGNMSTFNELSKSSTASVNNLSITEVSKLSQTFNAAIETDNLAKQTLEQSYKFQTEIAKAKSNLFEKANAALEKASTDAFSKMMENSYSASTTYNHDAFVKARAEWSAALSKQRDLKSGIIDADTALVELTAVAEIDASIAAEKASEVAATAAKAADNAQKAADAAASKASEAAAQAASENATSEVKAAAAEAQAAAEAAATEAKAATAKAAQAATEKVAAEAAKAAATQATKEAVESSANIAAAEAASQAKAAAAQASKSAQAAKEAAEQAAAEANEAAKAAAAQAAKDAAEVAAKAAAEAAAQAAKEAAEQAAKEAAQAAKEAAEQAAKEAAASKQAALDELTREIKEINDAIYGEGKTAGTSSGPTDSFNDLPFDQKMELFDKLKEKKEEIGKVSRGQ